MSGKRKESLSGKREECWNSIETDLIAMPSARHYALPVNKQLGPKKTQLCSVVTLLQLLSHSVCKVQVSAVRAGVVYATHCFGRTAHARAAPGSADHLLPPTESRSLFSLFFFSIRDRPSHPLIGVAGYWQPLDWVIWIECGIPGESKLELSAATPGSDSWPGDKHGTSGGGSLGRTRAPPEFFWGLSLAHWSDGQLGGGQPPHLQQHGAEQQAEGGFSFFRHTCS